MPRRLVGDDHPLFTGIPRMLGFAAMARESHDLAPSTIRGYYLKDLARGDWRLMPVPDVLLLRTDGSPLPGWSQETVGLWLRTRPGAAVVTASARDQDGRRAKG